MNAPKTVLVTGCDSGLGREFARQYAEAGWQVWATYRDLANALDAPSMQHRALDLTRFEQMDALAAELRGTPIDLLVSNAGVGNDTRTLGSLDYGHIHTMLAVNLVGALRLVECLLDNIQTSRARRIVFISSRMGSISSNLSGGHYGYRASKAGLNAMARSLALDLYGRGITVANLHPGWVDTAGGSPDAPHTPQSSVAAMRATIARLGNHETGVFLNYDGQILPW